jgi:chromate reductase
MIYIISGTDRPGSRTRQVADQVLNTYKAYTKSVDLIDLADLPMGDLSSAKYDAQKLSAPIQNAIQKVDTSDGLVVITPEYNGSMPGALKYFIDHWSYPRSFENRPVAFIGLGFRWGGLRPVEHLQQVFNYRNAFIYPERVFMTNISNVLVDGKIVDAGINQLIDKQARGFVRFIQGLRDQRLHPNTKEAST